MTCTRTRQMLDAWIDDELDAATSSELARHVAGCPACSALQAERETLRSSMKSGAHYYTAPSSLRPAVLRQLTAAQPVRLPKAPRASWWQMAALATSAAVLGSLLTVWMLKAPIENSPASPWREQVVAHHVASLTDPRHLIDVISSDQHTVKPWFHGKLDFAPTVVDLATQGYLLRGARLDRFEQLPAAALVYQLREHPINLFMTRATHSEPLTIHNVRGFNVATWASDGVRFAAVADTDAREIERFAGLLQTPH